MPQSNDPSTIRIKTDVLKALRVQQGWSRRRLAKEIGCSPGAIDNAENGKRVELRTAAEIAQAFGLQSEDLVEPEPTEPERVLQNVPEPVRPNEPLTNQALLVDEGACLIIKAHVEIRIPKNGTIPPQVYALLELLKSSLPDSADIKILSITSGLIFIACAKSKANILELEDADFRQGVLNLIDIQSLTAKNTPLSSLKEFTILPPGVDEKDLPLARQRELLKPILIRALLQRCGWSNADNARRKMLFFAMGRIVEASLKSDTLPDLAATYEQLIKFMMYDIEDEFYTSK